MLKITIPTSPESFCGADGTYDIGAHDKYNRLLEYAVALEYPSARVDVHTGDGDVRVNGDGDYVDENAVLATLEEIESDIYNAGLFWPH